MSRTVIVAVGGTGQLVLHYYAQLFQIGAIKDPFHGVVIDSDRFLPWLREIQEFWDTLKLAHPEPEDLPKLEYVPILRDLQGNVGEAIAGEVPNAPRVHPVEAFFDWASLQQDVQQGLFARPALSSVMMHRLQELPWPDLDVFDRVLVVGSLIGGTGGGLIAPILKQLVLQIHQGGGGQQPQLRAVLFGTWFRVDNANRLVQDGPTRYPSNKLLVAHTIKELAPPELSHFIFIEPEVPGEREIERDFMPWPARTHPMWLGVSALEEVRTNNIWPADVHFLDKERQMNVPRDRARDWTALENVIGLANALDERKLLERIPHELWVEAIYGRQLPRVIANAFAAGERKPELGIHDICAFGRELQASYSNRWNRLKPVFPNVAGTEANPARLRSTHWGALKTEVPELSHSRESLLSASSALILYRALRGGGHA